MTSLGTAETGTSLLTTLADNSTGNISEGDLRNALESVRQDYGQIYEEGNASATTMSVTSTFYDATLSGTTLSTEAANFDSPATGDLRYTGATDRVFLVMASATATCATASQSMDFAIGIDGTKQDGSLVNIDSEASSQANGFAISFICTLSQNEVLTVMIANNTATNNITLTDFNLKAIGMLA